MKKQVVVIHGGGTFESHNQFIRFLKKQRLDLKNLNKKYWKDNLQEKLGRGYMVILPRMPNSNNASYDEWKIWFEKHIPLLEKKVVLVGHSLGGSFLAQYLSENKFPKKILATILVAAGFNREEYTTRSAGFVLRNNLGLMKKQSRRIIFYHSRNDKNVPFTDFLEYKKLLPSAVFREYTKRGHFTEGSFSELYKDIKESFT